MQMSGRTLRAGAVCLLFVVGACAGTSPVPQPRTVIVFSGERIQTDGERMQEVEQWLRPALEDIDQNPSFLIRVHRQEEDAYLWDSTELVGDTAIVHVQRAAADAETPHLIYAHLHLMAERSELGEWLAVAREDDLEGLELEMAILRRVSDIWLLGRAVFDTQAYGPLDELLYAADRGLLTEFILATQGDRFEEERAAFTEEFPEWEGELTEFFQRTFERDGPGYLRTDASS